LWKENFIESENKSPYESHHMQFCFWYRASAFQDTQFLRINHDLLFMDLTNFKANWLSFQLWIVRDSEFSTFCNSDSSVISVIRGFSHFHSFRFNVDLLLYIFFEFENSVPVIQPPSRSATLLYRALQYRILSYAAPGQFFVCWPRWFAVTSEEWTEKNDYCAATAVFCFGIKNSCLYNTACSIGF